MPLLKPRFFGLLLRRAFFACSSLSGAKSGQFSAFANKCQVVRFFRKSATLRVALATADNCASSRRRAINQISPVELRLALFAIKYQICIGRLWSLGLARKRKPRTKGAQFAFVSSALIRAKKKPRDKRRAFLQTRNFVALFALQATKSNAFSSSQISVRCFVNKRATVEIATPPSI